MLHFRDKYFFVHYNHLKGVVTFLIKNFHYIIYECRISHDALHIRFLRFFKEFF